MGGHDVEDSTEYGRFEVRSSTYKVHPNWDSGTLQNDIAVIRLPKPIVITSKSPEDSF